MKRRFSCFLANLGWYLLPFTAFRDWLLQVHLEHCPECQEELVGQDEALKLLATDECSWPPELIARAEMALQKVDTESQKARSGKGLNWFGILYAGLSALIVTVLMAGFAWYLARQGETDMNAWLDNTNKTEIVSKVSISYIRAMGQPAATYIFQTENPQMVIIWAEAVN